MEGRKLFNTRLAAVMLAAVMAAVSLTGCTAVKKASKAASYETALFSAEKPMTIDIEIAADQWKDIIDNAVNKQWHSCDITVNGTKYENVGIRTKGASSLDSISNDRYSFKVKFNKYVKGQKCFGLDKLCLNNNYGDATNMKEALVYDMFRFLDADASLYNYAKLTVNGKYFGVYLALEAVDKSFMKRNYGLKTGAMYKPGAEAGGKDEKWDESAWENWDESDWDEEAFVAGGGSDLKYIDDNLESYYSIWPTQVNQTNDKDHKRVIEALKNIGEQNNLEQYLDIEKVIRYMAVHNFSVNHDSLSGEGDHNYYLHERDGKLSIVPWDYNLCLGAYEIEENEDHAETASDVVNYPIDDHWRITNFFDGILDHEEYRAKYHECYQKLIDEYVRGGGFEQFYIRTRTNIDDLVKTDPHALYTYAEYDAAAKMLKEIVALRGSSVKGQLGGTIASTKAAQKASPDKLINADKIDLQVMGSDMGNYEMDDWLNTIENGGDQNGN